MRLRLMQTASETNGDLLEMEATYEPGSVEPLEHFHPNQDEHFEILAGRMEAQVGGERRTLSEGDVLDIPAGTVHAMWNSTGNERASSGRRVRRFAPRSSFASSGGSPRRDSSRPRAPATRW
jgi:mannose-6-phosphate isomerase class I